MEVSGQFHASAVLSRAKSTRYPLDARLGGPRAGLDAAASRKNPIPCRESNSTTLTQLSRPLIQDNGEPLGATTHRNVKYMTRVNLRCRVTVWNILFLFGRRTEKGRSMWLSFVLVREERVGSEAGRETGYTAGFYILAEIQEKREDQSNQ
jgi:hypothetical protein